MKLSHRYAHIAAGLALLVGACEAARFAGQSQTVVTAEVLARALACVFLYRGALATWETPPNSRRERLMWAVPCFVAFFGAGVVLVLCSTSNALGRTGVTLCYMAVTGALWIVAMDFWKDRRSQLDA